MMGDGASNVEVRKHFETKRKKLEAWPACQVSCNEQDVGNRVDAAASSARTLASKKEKKRRAAEKKKEEEEARRIKAEQEEELSIFEFGEGEESEAMEEDEEAL